MNALKTLLAGAALAVTATAGNAASYYADKVIASGTQYGTCTGTTSGCNLDDRKNVANAVDTDDSTFYSLGFGGWLTVGFAEALITGPQNVATFEITFNRVHGHKEAADVYSVLGGVETFLGRITNQTEKNVVRAWGDFEHIKIKDVTLLVWDASETTSYDGFDVASVKISPVPLPAAGAMLLAGLGGFAALRRRKTAA